MNKIDPGDLIKALAKELRATIGATGDLETQLKSDQAQLQRADWQYQLPAAPHPTFSFSPLLVEPMLREGSLLLDRCLQERREINELSAKWFETCVQIDELLALNDITSNEESLYDIPAQLDDAQAQSELDQKTGFDSASAAWKEAAEETDQNGDTLADAVGISSWSQGAAQWPNLEVGPWAGYNVPANLPVKDAMYNGAIKPAKHSIYVEERTLRAQQQLNQANSTSAGTKNNGFVKSAAYKRRQASFQIGRNNVSRSVAIRRAWALTRTGGELNYLEQKEPISNRLLNDINAACVRLGSAAIGMQLLYGYAEKFPQSANGLVNLDDVIYWCQAANLWLAALQQSEQTLTRSFSLKQLIGQANFDAGSPNSGWQFELDETEFAGRKLLRVRGLSVQVAINSGLFGGRIQTNLNAALTPPSKAPIYRPDGSSAELNPNGMGTLFVGRVRDRSYSVPPELTSSYPSFNVSPLGIWTIELQDGSGKSAPIDGLEDVDVHLMVALV